MITERSRIVGVVLCGGAGSRLGGVDKPLQHWHGRPLIDQVLERIEPQVERVCISANRNLERYQQRAPVVVDAPLQQPVDATEPGRRPQTQLPQVGPLAGVLAAARWYTDGPTHSLPETSGLLICPGDSPRVPRDLVERLAATQAEAAYVNDGERPHPLHALVSLACALTIESFLERGGRSALGWLETQQARVVRIADPDAFYNVNAPEDFGA